MIVTINHLPLDIITNICLDVKQPHNTARVNKLFNKATKESFIHLRKGYESKGLITKKTGTDQEVVHQVASRILNTAREFNIIIPENNICPEHLLQLKKEIHDINLIRFYSKLKLPNGIIKPPFEGNNNKKAEDIRKWIYENKNILNQITVLYLSNSGLTEIPPEISLFNNLRILTLENNKITDISPLANLTALNTLWLYNNQIVDISPLANLTVLNTLLLLSNQITDISPLANLTELNILFLGNNQIKHVSPLRNIAPNFKYLDLKNNPITDRDSIVDYLNITPEL